MGRWWIVATLFALAALAGGDQNGVRAQTPDAARAETVDPFSIPPEVRPWTREESARVNERTRAAFALRERGDLAQSTAIWRELLTLMEATWGPRHLATSIFLNYLANDLDIQGRATEAEQIHRRALAIAEARLGATHLNALVFLDNLAQDVQHQGRYADAEQLHRRALAIAEGRLGPDHPDTLANLDSLARDLRELGRYAEAEALHRRALAAAETRLGADDPQTLSILNNLAVDVEMQARYAEAEALYRRALTASEARLGADHPETLTKLANLALAIDQRGDHAAAEALHRRALAGREARLGPDHLETLESRENLASNLNDQGRPLEAEALHRRVLAGREARLGVDHPDTLRSLSNLAATLANEGRFAEAEALDRRALAGREARLGADHPETLTSLNNLAEDLREQGRPAEAEAFNRRALAGYESRLGADHPDTVRTLSNLALDLASQRRFAEAEPLDRRALAAREARLGSEHPETLISVNNLGLDLRELRRAAEAETLLARAARSQANRYGEEHPTLATFQYNLALGRIDTGDAAGALEAARSSLRIRRALLDRVGTSASDATRRALTGGVTGAGSAAMLVVRAAWTRAQEAPQTAAPMLPEAFDAAQTARVSTSAEALAQGAARRAADAVGAGAAVLAWREAQARVAALDDQIVQAAQAGAEGDVRRNALLTERAAAAVATRQREDMLASRFPRYFDLLKQRPVALAELQGNDGLLRPDEALVLMVPGEPALPEAQSNGLVFVVTRERAVWAPIGFGNRALTREVAAIHATLADDDAGATLAPGAPRPTNRFDRARAFALYRALFGAPQIAAALDGKSRYTIAPQGVLMSLPFAALPVAAPAGDDADPAALRGTQWLGIAKTLAVVPSVSSLRVQRRNAAQRSSAQRTPFFGLGDPAFRGVADGATRGDLHVAPLQSARAYFRGAVADAATLATLPRLPGTAEEIRLLAQNLGAGRDAYLLQLDANEGELQRRDASGALGRAEIIAFATHGLMAGELQNTVAEPALALTPPSGPTPGPENDGLLTASEAANLHVSARFVLLSACNTAAGGAPDAEALSGLARAFLYAGAQSLLVSHYPVFDVAGMRLTTEAARIARGEGVSNPDAMRRSMETLMRDTANDASGESFAHPAQWAVYAVIDAS